MTEAVFAYEIGFFVVTEVCKKVKHLVILLSHNEKTPWIFSRGLFEFMSRLLSAMFVKIF